MEQQPTLFQKIKAYLKASWQRFNTESPKYWQVLQSALKWIAIATATVSDYGQYIIVQVTGYGLNVPDSFKIIMGHIATATFFAKLISQLAIDKDVVPRRTYEKLQDPVGALPANDKPNIDALEKL